MCWQKSDKSDKPDRPDKKVKSEVVGKVRHLILVRPVIQLRQVKWVRQVRQAGPVRHEKLGKLRQLILLRKVRQVRPVRFLSNLSHFLRHKREINKTSNICATSKTFYQTFQTKKRDK